MSDGDDDTSPIVSDDDDTSPVVSDDDNDQPTLSAHALAALTQFYEDQKSREEADECKNAMPEEDWQLSQFWYDEETTDTLAQEVLMVAEKTGRIACISCPTLYCKLKDVIPPECRLVLLEYDRRFSKFGEDFVFYDYNKPLDLPSDLHRSFDLVVADPPFLSEECLLKTSQTVRLLAKEKVMLCTGAVMEENAVKFLNVRKCDFIPRHNRNLGNDFGCFVNYDTLFIDKNS